MCRKIVAERSEILFLIYFDREMSIEIVFCTSKSSRKFFRAKKGIFQFRSFWSFPFMCRDIQYVRCHMKLALIFPFQKPYVCHKVWCWQMQEKVMRARFYWIFWCFEVNLALGWTNERMLNNTKGIKIKVILLKSKFSIRLWLTNMHPKQQEKNKLRSMM
jgi:hypothetical protein